MPGVSKFRHGDVVYEAFTTNVVGGQLVQAVTGTTESGCQGVAPAAAGSLACVGVASEDAVTAANRAALESGTTLGYPFINVSIPNATLTVYNDDFVQVTYAAAAAYRVPLKCAANGTVTPWVHGTDTDLTMIVGWCAQPGGVSAAGLGLARIDI